MYIAKNWKGPNMGVLKWGGKVVTNVINIRVDHWVGAGYLKKSIGQTCNLAKSLFTAEKPEHQETFEESLVRLNISAADLKIRETQLVRLFAIHLLIALVIFSYSIYLFYSANWAGGCMSLCLALYPLALAFRFHFWLFQIKQRKLGCTIKEWWNNK